MSFPAAETFHERFSALSRDEAEAYVADLWRARGWDVESSDGRLVLRQSAGAPARTLYVLGASPNEVPSNDADAVVLTTDSSNHEIPDDVASINPAELYRMTKYAVDRHESERLLATHFDDIRSESGASCDEAPNTGDECVAAPHSDSGDGVASGDSSDDGTVSSTPGQSSAEASTNETEVNRDGDEHPTGDGDTAGTATGRPSRRTVLITSGTLLAGIGSLVATGFSIETDTDSPIESRGLTADGVVDPASLAEGHATGIEDRSYSLALNLVVSDADRSLRSYLSMDLALASNRTYRTHVSTDGPEAPRFLGKPPATAVFWSDGEVYLVQRSPGETESFTEFEPASGYAGTWQYWARTVPFGGTFSSRPEEYFQTVFEAVPTRLVERQTGDETSRYRIANDGTQLRSPSTLSEQGISNVRDVQLDAVVDEHSVVRSFELQFVAETKSDPVEFYRTLDYSALGETEVERPTSGG